MNETIEAAARARGISVEALRAEAAEFARLRNKGTSTVRSSTNGPAIKGSRPSTPRPGSVALRERRPTASQTTQAASAADIEAQLAAAFQRGGLSAERAVVAARGRTRVLTSSELVAAHEAAANKGARPASASLAEAGRELGLSPAAAKVFVRGRGGLREAVTDGSGFKATDYAYAPDPEDPPTWKLLLVKQPGDGALGAYDPDLVRAAATALAVPEWGAPQVDIPAADLPAVKQAVRGAWIQADLPVAEIPPALDEAALAAAFQRRGLSAEAAAVAARGRGRRS
jgi:hypothetical protein